MSVVICFGNYASNSKPSKIKNCGVKKNKRKNCLIFGTYQIFIIVGRRFFNRGVFNYYQAIHGYVELSHSCKIVSYKFEIITELIAILLVNILFNVKVKMIDAMNTHLFQPASNLPA